MSREMTPCPGNIFPLNCITCVFSNIHFCKPDEGMEEGLYICAHRSLNCIYVYCKAVAIHKCSNDFPASTLVLLLVF